MPTLDDLPTLAQIATLKANDLVAFSSASSGGCKVKSVPAALASLFTHVVRVDYTSGGINTTAGTTKVINLFPIPNPAVINDVHVVVATPFTGGAISAATIRVGKAATVTGSATHIPALSSVFTRTAFENGGSALNAYSSVDVNSTPSQFATLEIVSTGANLTALTAGSLYVFYNMTEPADLLSMGIPALA
jgi:hypothetical protein